MIKHLPGADPSPQGRAKRARAIRKALRFSRHTMTEKYGIRPGTLQNWEDARHGGLTDDGANQLAAAYQAENVTCSPEWLFYGIGPHPLGEAAAAAEANIPPDHKTALTAELQLFYQHHRQAMDAVVTDDALWPVLWKDDHVAGERYYGEDIQKAINAPCMIQLQTGEMLIRFLEETKPGIYQLTCTNPKTTIKPKRQKDVNILSAAPILWIRRKSIKVKT